MKRFTSAHSLQESDAFLLPTPLLLHFPVCNVLFSLPYLPSWKACACSRLCPAPLCPGQWGSMGSGGIGGQLQAADWEDPDPGPRTCSLSKRRHRKYSRITAPRNSPQPTIDSQLVDKTPGFSRLSWMTFYGRIPQLPGFPQQE